MTPILRCILRQLPSRLHSCRLLSALVIIFTGMGCSVVARHRLNELYGEERVVARTISQSEAPALTVDFERDVRPILFNRCAVCHGCYDAACQLKLTSFEGVDRGAIDEAVYPPARLTAADPTRLYTDAKDTKGWRKRGFFPVLNERNQNPQTNLEASLLFKMLALKARYPFPGTNPIPDSSMKFGPIDVGPMFDQMTLEKGKLTDPKLWPPSMNFGTSRQDVCPALDEFGSYEEEHPLHGMPFGLPPLSQNELYVLTTWLKEGALNVVPTVAPIGEAAAEDEQALNEWERFLNGASLKEKLMSRYLFEHLFLANIHFSSGANTAFYKLIRSRTAPGLPPEEIATRRPYDDPKVERFYYRFRREREGIIAKTHLVYRFDGDRMARYRELFLTPQYTVDKLPSYDPETTSNPFRTFQQLPQLGRYRFLLDEAQFSVMSFIKGPVCRGDRAVNVIDDRFWVFFVDPDEDRITADAEFLSRESNNLRLPAESESNALPHSWLSYARMQRDYLAARNKFLKEQLQDLSKVNLGLLWDGDRKNRNAALTVFRHYDSATVVQGLVGDVPKTGWVIGYPLFERIHYLLVAGFDVYGNAPHQLMTRLYMDFLRMEAEQNFLAFLPREARMKELNFWYRDVGRRTRDDMTMLEDPDLKDPAIPYQTANPKVELFSMMRDRLGPSLSTQFDLPSSAPQALRAIGNVKGIPASFMAENILLRVKRRTGSDGLYTLLHDRALKNVAVFYSEDSREVPEEDAMTVVPGILGAYPNAFLVVDEDKLDELAERIGTLASESDYHALVERFGVRRGDPQFWAQTDWFQKAYREYDPIGSGLLDYSRIENR